MKDIIEKCKVASPYVWECEAESDSGDRIVYYRAYREYDGPAQEKLKQYDLEAAVIDRCYLAFGSCAWYSVEVIENPTR